MMAMTQIGVFVGALALVAYVMAATVFPALPRMMKLLRGELDPALIPHERLALTPRAAAARGRSPSLPAPAWREAA